VILEIDVQGAISVMEQIPEAVSIFILPPSFTVLQARLTARNTEDEADLALRLRNSFEEVSQYERFQYVIVNEEVPAASRMLASIIWAERQRRDRQTAAVQAILDSFGRAKHSLTGE
jgi:guanylate kinase